MERRISSSCRSDQRPPTRLTICCSTGEDVQAVRPTYFKHFAKVFRACPSLREIRWEATSEVTWTWFVRHQDAKNLLRDEVDVNFESLGPGSPFAVGEAGQGEGCLMM